MPRFVLLVASFLLALALSSCQGAGRASGEDAGNPISNPLAQSVDTPVTLDVPALAFCAVTPEEVMSCLLEGRTVSDTEYYEVVDDSVCTITTTEGFVASVATSSSFANHSSLVFRGPLARSVDQILGLAVDRDAFLGAKSSSTAESLWFCSPEGPSTR
ncbi:MAG: hypothetical protein LBL86_04770 [Coriobacteriales bacterium]|nr:hypothetical protein [Coriobacteriales bacterium]